MWNPFLPDTRTPADRAQALMHKCVNESGENPGVNPAAIEEVRPLITTVASNNDSAIHLRGAELQLRPIASLSPEGLQRTLECHQALVTLGRAAPFPDDPYVLDGAWLGLKVRSDGDAFIVTIQTDVLDEARTVLERARAYGARAGQVASAPAPAASSSAP
jgi:hypothetical protein